MSFLEGKSSLLKSDVPHSPRADGLVGYDVALTQRRSWVRFPVGVLFELDGSFDSGLFLKNRELQGSNLRVQAHLLSRQAP